MRLNMQAVAVKSVLSIGTAIFSILSAAGFYWFLYIYYAPSIKYTKYATYLKDDGCLTPVKLFSDSSETAVNLYLSISSNQKSAIFMNIKVLQDGSAHFRYYLPHQRSWMSGLIRDIIYMYPTSINLVKDQDSVSINIFDRLKIANDTGGAEISVCFGGVPLLYDAQFVLEPVFTWSVRNLFARYPWIGFLVFEAVVSSLVILLSSGLFFYSSFKRVKK
jgi:hypothetical protein